MHRQDGRGPEEFRPACLQQGVLTRAQGSAFVELGRTKVMVGVFGPREHTDQGREPYSSVGRTTVDISIVTFPRRPKMGPRKTREEVHLASLVQEAVTSSLLLDRFPKLFVDINCTVLESDGSVATALILATSLALAHAGIEMKDTVSSCTVCLEKGGTGLFIDPDGDEERKSSGTAIVAVAPASGQMTYISSWGSWTEDMMQKAIHMAVGGCIHVHSELQRTMVQQEMDTEPAMAPPDR
mmetsp:Transcript_3902/g.7912  ORF Transcript_3902/g.7912 Transcript_3902/m.7912 type:complete len:240 (+) Transcript_3902:78-797(+)